MLFLFFTELSLILVIVYVGFKFNTYNLEMQELYDENSLWLFYLPKRMPDYFFERRIIMGIKIAVIAISGIFVFPLMLLVLVQIRNFCAAKTTNERFSKRKPGSKGANIADSTSSDSMSGNLLNPEDDQESKILHIQYEKNKNCVSNCFDM
mmetsp:Transcript_2728/g.3188  ORF Transcript_2728/g.3188 Transcript_2728/m.3188 type:complete len:151 (+) Transcript_2728:882-1334(+)